MPISLFFYLSSLLPSPFLPLTSHKEATKNGNPQMKSIQVSMTQQREGYSIDVDGQKEDIQPKQEKQKFSWLLNLAFR